MIARASRPSVHAVALACVAVSVLAAAAILPLDTPPLSLFACPFRAATGVPCLGCGAMHAFHHVARGELLAALSWSPLATLAAVAGAAHALWTALRLCGLPFAPKIVPTPALRWAAAAALAANWVFVWLSGRA